MHNSLETSQNIFNTAKSVKPREKYYQETMIIDGKIMIH